MITQRILLCSLILFPILLAFITITNKTTPGKKTGVVILPEKHVIEINRFEFEPGRLNISVGDTVVWANYDLVPHTATAVDSTWDVSNIQEGTTGSNIFVANEAGIFPYFCRFHPTMKATLIVE